MILTKERTESASSFQVDLWLRWYIEGTEGVFEESLMKTITRANGVNRDKLRTGFPEEVRLYERYLNS